MLSRGMLLVWLLILGHITKIIESRRPTLKPTSEPTAPSETPSLIPTEQPTSPTGLPTGRPTGTHQPTAVPTGKPSGRPTGTPTFRPTAPTGTPSGRPSARPSHKPSGKPTGAPTFRPTSPTAVPSGRPSGHPTGTPTYRPTAPTGTPSARPSGHPTRKPTGHPSGQPTYRPTAPTGTPSGHPTSKPSISQSPTSAPVYFNGEALCAVAAGFNISPTLGLTGWSCIGGAPLEDPCTWTGVTCGGDLAVNKVVLQFPVSAASTTTSIGGLSPSIGLLSSLQWLILENLHLQGTIPTEIGQLVNLERFILINNYFTGTIPTEIGLVGSTLQRFQVHNDVIRSNLTGPIPTEIGLLSNLGIFNVTNNHLNGVIPTQLGLLTKLTDVWAGSNDLVGVIPSQLGISSNGPLSQLRILNLQFNGLTGHIPSELGVLCRRYQVDSTLAGQRPLQLDLSDNLLTGVIPRELLGYAGSVAPNTFKFILSYLNLRGNLLTGNLNGNGGTSSYLTRLATSDAPIAPATKRHYFLILFDVSSNKLTGSIPSELGLCLGLTNLELSFNSFTGVIPSSLFAATSLVALGAGNLPLLTPQPLNPAIAQLTNLVFVGLKADNLIGTIPTQLGVMTKLTELVLDFNSFTGPIPTELAQLSGLEKLWLRDNQLTGYIPDALYELTALNTLPLTNNLLSGSVSSLIGQLTGLTQLLFDRNYFSGSLPTELGLLSRLQELTVDGNFFSGTITDVVCGLQLETFRLCSECNEDGSSTRLGCPLLTSVPACVFATPSPFTYKCLGSLRGELAEVPALTIATLPLSSSTSTSISIQVSLTTVNYAYVSCAAVVAGSVLSSTIQITSHSHSVYYTNIRSAVYTINDLLPLVSYDVYCSATSLYFVSTPLADVIATKTTQTTACCRPIVFTYAPASILLESNTSNINNDNIAFAYQLSTPPSLSVTIEHVCSDSSVQVVQNSATFTHTSAILSSSFILIGNPGTYTVSLVATGSSASEYDTTRVANIPVTIYSTTTSTAESIRSLTAGSFLPAPALASALFSDNGGSAIVSFSAPTDLAGITTPQFACSVLFQFAEAAACTCSWLNTTAVNIGFPSALVTALPLPLPVVGDTLTLLPNKLRVACTALHCDANPTSNSQSTLFLIPLHPVTPSVSLHASSVYGLGEDVVIDPTYTSGGGGRPWTSVAWQISTTGVFNGNMNGTVFAATYLDPYSVNTNLQTPLVLPGYGTVLPSGATYVLSLSVTNFLGQTSSASTQFVIVDTLEAPKVSILGPASVSIHVYDELYLQSLVSSTSSSNYALSYRWTITEQPSTTPLSSITSTSLDPRVFRLPSYTLNALSTYTITVYADVVGAIGVAGNASVQVFVSSASTAGSSSVRAVITGGDERVIAVDLPFTLDGSASTDISSTTSSLSYAWSCVYAAGATYGASCDSVFGSSSAAASTVSIAAHALSLGAVYRFVLVCSTATGSGGGGSSDSAFVLVQTTASGAPAVALTSSSARANVNDIVKLSGNISASYAVGAQWQVVSSGTQLAMTDIATSPIDKGFPLSVSRPEIAFSVGIDCSKLVAGSSYRFTVAVYPDTLTELTATASLTIAVNTPPSQGYLSTVPATGVAFSTLFVHTAVGWVAEQDGYPLQYMFQFTAQQQKTLTIGSKGLKTSVSSELPPGAPTVPLLLTVYDAFGATATASNSVVVVTDAAASSPDTVLGSFTAALNKSSLSHDIDLALQAVNNVATYLASSTTITHSSGVDVSVHDFAIGAMCDTLTTVTGQQDASPHLLETVLGSFSQAFDPSKVVSPTSLQSCLGLLTNLSSLVATNTPPGTAGSSAALQVSQLVSLMLVSFDQFTSNTSSLSSITTDTTSTMGDSLDNVIAALIQGVLSNLIAGAPAVTLNTDKVQLSVYHELLSDLYNYNLQSSAASLTLPVDGLNACGSSSSGYAQLSLTAYSSAPYASSGNITTSIVRLASSKDNIAIASPSSADSSFLLTLPFTSAQDFTPVPIGFGNYTVKRPECTVRQGNTFQPCHCDLLSYNSATATFNCSTLHNLCGTTTRRRSRGLQSGSSSTSSSNDYSSTDDVSEYGALLNSVVEVVGDTILSTKNPFDIHSKQSAVVLAVVFIWLFILFAGLWYFHRWDRLDHKVLLYAPIDVDIQNRALPTIQHLKEMRKHLDDAFLTGALITEDEFDEDHHEYNRRQRWISCTNILLYWCLPMGKSARSRLSILVGGTLIPRFVQSVVRYHPFTWMFTDRSLEKTRVLRFMTMLKMILVSIFISTIFFSVYFPDDSLCTTYNHSNANKCLSVPSKILSGQSECRWDDSSLTCSVKPPPETASFIIIVAILTTIVFAPFDLLYYVVLNTVCNRRPILEYIGLNTFTWLGSMGDISIKHELNVIKAVHYTLRALHAYELRLQDNAVSEFERGKMKLVLSKLGLVEKHGQIDLSFLSSLLHRDIQSRVTAQVLTCHAQATLIIKNMKRYSKASAQESYLLQHFLMEQYDTLTGKAAQLSLRRQFTHYAHDLPLTVHPVPWALAWCFIIGSAIFFIYWILAWGTSTSGLALVNWGTNFTLHMLIEVFVISLVRIFIINILVIEMLKPGLVKLHNWFMHMRTIDEETGKVKKSYSFHYDASEVHDGLEDSRLLQVISPVTVAAQYPDFNDLISARMIGEVQDSNYYSYKIDAYKAKEAQEDNISDDNNNNEKKHDGDVRYERPQRDSFVALVHADAEADV